MTGLVGLCLFWLLCRGVAQQQHSLRRIYEGPAQAWPSATLPDGVELRELAPAPLPSYPAQGSRDAALMALGQALFEDPRLSPSGEISCQSCHNRQLGWGDGLRVAMGAKRTAGHRNSPSLFVAHAQAQFFWDGRVSTLSEQAIGPLTDPQEMANADIASLIERLNATPDLPERFRDVFGTATITQDRVTTALAAFQRHLDRPTPLDQFLLGDGSKLTDEQILGLHLFRTKARCLTCHNGPYLTDQKYHSLGLTFMGGPFEDLGRYQVTGNPADIGAFRTPSLRHLSKTAPYMHNGLFRSLENVLALYVAGGGRQKPPTADHPLFEHADIGRQATALIEPLTLSKDEEKALLAFLEAL